MSISTISSSTFSVSQLANTTGMSQANGTSDSGSIERCSPGGGHGGGGLLGAISQALSQIGVSNQSGADSANSDSASDSSTQDPAQALTSFMHNLMEALHAQSANPADKPKEANGEGSNSAQAPTGVHGGHHSHGGPGKLEADLQSLIQKLSSSTSDTSTTDQTSSTSGTTDAAESNLEQSFSNLMKALGNTDSNATLNNFLQALQSNMQSVGPAGNVVNTKV